MAWVAAVASRAGAVCVVLGQSYDSEKASATRGWVSQDTLVPEPEYLGVGHARVGFALHGGCAAMLLTQRPRAGAVWLARGLVVPLVRLVSRWVWREV